MTHPMTDGDPAQSVRILHLEDNPRDTQFIRDVLDADGLACEITRVDTESAFEATLRDSLFDLVLCDYNLPGYDGITALKRARELQPETPVVVVSGALSEDEAVSCLHFGAADYLLKQRLDRLPSAVRRSLDEAARRREIARAADRLRESERRHRTLLDNLQGMVYRRRNGPEGPIEFASQGCQDLLGVAPQALVAGSIDYMSLIHPEDLKHYRDRMKLGVAAGNSCAVEYRVRYVDDSWRWVLDRSQAIRGADGGILAMEGFVADITERKLLEEQFLQSQKMESIGRLAGGIAHDFNNLLSVIIGYADFALQSLPEDVPMHEDIRQIREAGDRATALTRQLLAFSRKQVLCPQVLDLRAVVESQESMLRRLIGEDVNFVAKAEPTIGRVRIDPGQITQVIMNLAVNARDAMPTGGHLTIELKNADLDARYCDDHYLVEPGAYVLLAISDTGMGMNRETLAKIFEPFFTTKEAGKGTGLGLATVYGIVKQSGGHIFVYSEEGRGTTFKIYLPRVPEDIAADAAREAAQSVMGSGVVLLVEDDTAMRVLSKRVLDVAGYTVIAAGSADEALQLLAGHAGPINLLLCDVILPDKNGSWLAERLLSRYSELKVLFMSGYMDDAIVRHGILDEQAQFIGKPFTGAQLTNRIRQILAPAQGGSAG